VWQLFKSVHGKTYSSAAEEALRMQIFLEKVDNIQQHNTRYEAGEESFTMAVNKFSDMLTSEVNARLNGFNPPANTEATATFVALDSNAPLPDTVDWRTEGIVTPVKDIENCGAGWAVSSTGSLEGQHAQKTGTLLSLSEQQLVDCSTVALGYKNGGCKGGLMDYSFDYLKAVGGIEAEPTYPFVAKDGTCSFNKSEVVTTVTGFVSLTKYEEVLKQAVATIGPISAAIDGSHPSFQSYNSGVYYEADCSSTEVHTAVLVVGYGTEDTNDYWLVKNAFGPSWGDHGYIKMSRNKNNNCGIATHTLFPTVA